MSPNLSPRPGQGLLPRSGGQVGGRSSAACVTVTGRRQRFVLHGSQIAPIADSAPLSAVEWAAITKRRSASSGAAAAGPDAGLDVRGEMRAQAELCTSRCARLGGVNGVIPLSPTCQPGSLPSPLSTIVILT